MLGRLAPQLAVGNGLKPKWISHDPRVVQAYIDDPLVHDRVTPLLVQFIVDTTGKQTLADLRSYQDWYLRYYLKSVPGVAEVAPLGGFVRQYQVNVDLLWRRRGLHGRCDDWCGCRELG